MNSLRGHKRVLRFVKVGKGVSQVIAVLLMIAIAVIAGLVAYFWVTGFFVSRSSVISKAIQVQSVYYTGNETGQGNWLYVYVQNVGKGQVTLIAGQCLYVDGALQGSANIIDPVKKAGYTTYALQESNSAEIVDQIGLSLGQTYKLKVVTSEGTFVEYYFTVNYFTGQSPYSITVIVDPAGSGTVTPDKDPPYAYGDVVTLTPSPNLGYAFSGWNGDGSGSSTRTVTVTGIMSVTATFVQVFDHFTIAGYPPTVTAGNSFGGVTVKACDAANNVVTGYAGKVYFESSDASATLPFTSTSEYTFTVGDAGVHTFSGFTLKTTGSQNITVTNGTISATSNPITVNPAPASKLVYTAGTGQSLTAGQVSQVVTVQRQDQYGNPTTTGGISVSLTSTSGKGQFYSDSGGTVKTTQATISDGSSSASFYYEDLVAGNSTLTASYTGLTNASTRFTINAGALDHFTIYGYPPIVTAGQSFGGVKVTTYDAANNVITDYTGQVYFNSSDASATLPFTSTSEYTFTVGDAGVHTFSGFTLYTVGSQTSQTITVTNGTISATSDPIIVNPASGSKLVYTAGAGQSLPAGNVSQVITVQLQDQYGNPTIAISGDIPVSLTSNSSSGTFYSDPGGTVPITDVTILNGSSSASFYYNDFVVGNPVLTASSTGLTDATTQFTINAGALNHFTIAGYPTSVTAGQNFGSNNVVVTACDIYGNVLTDYSGQVYFTSTDGQAVMPYTSGNKYTFTGSGAGNDNGAHVFAGTGFTLKTAGSQTINVTDGSVSTTSNPITVNAGSAVSLKVSAPGPATAGNAFSVTVTAKDAYNNTVTGYVGTVHFTTSDTGTGKVVPSDYTFVSSDNGTHTFSNGVTLVTAGSQTVTATDTVTSITGSATVAVGAGSASKLVYVAGAGQTIAPGTVSAIITVQRQDMYGNPVTSGSITVTLTVTGSSTGQFYQDAAGQTPISSISIADTTSSASFYYEDTATGNPILTASSLSLASAATQIMITGSTKLVYTMGTSQTLNPGEISGTITVQRQNTTGAVTSGNLVVNLASTSSSGTFYLDSGGSTPTTSITIVAGSSTASFYYMDTSAGSPQLTASSGSLTPAKTTFTISALSASQLAFTNGTLQAIAPGVTSSVITVQIQNSNGIPVPVATGSRTVSLTSTSSNGHFYSDSAGTKQITSVAIPAGQSSANFYYKDTTIGTPMLTASSTGLTSATTYFDITNAYKLVFTAGVPQSLTVGEQSTAITVQSQNQNGAPVTQGTALIVNLTSTSGGGSFYDDILGFSIGPTNSVYIALGSSTAQFFYEDTSSGSPTLTASAIGLTSATTKFTITGTSEPVFSATISPTSAVLGSVGSYTYTITDASSNGIDVGYATIQVPAGFSGVVVSSYSASGGNNWVATSSGNTITLHAITSGDTLGDGESVQVIFTATAPSSAGTYQFTPTVYQNYDGTGSGPGTINGAIPTVTVGTGVSITVTSSPTGSGFVTVDGSAVTTPHTFTWVQGSTHTLAASSPVSGGTGIQYNFTNWSALSFGSSSSQTYTYTAPSSAETVTANYQMQYSLSVTSTHDSPNPLTGTNWYNSGTSVTASVTSPADQSGGTQYRCSGWSGTGSVPSSGTGTSTTFTITQASTITWNWVTQYRLTVTSTHDSPNPAVGNNWYDSGTSVTASVTSPADQSGGTQYRCSGWSGTGSVPSSGTGTSTIFTISRSSSITWNWVTQYQLSFAVSPSGSDGSTNPSGTNVWYDSGSLSISATPTSGYVFLQWSSTGSITFTNAGSASTTATISGAGTITANFAVAVSITVTSSPTTGSGYVNVDGTVITTPQVYTWAVGSTHTLAASSPVSGGTGVQYAFTGWSALSFGSSSSQTYTYSVPSSAETVTANYQTQYYLTVSSSHGSTTGQGWYNSGATAYAGLNSGTVSGGTGTQYVFTSWSGGASGTNYAQSNSITMNAPETATANWQTQYYLTVNNGGQGTASGQGWYNSTTSASFSISPTTVSGGNGVQYVFTGWSGSGSGHYTGSSSSYSVTMNNAITETANWQTQYKVTFDYQVSGGGSGYSAPSVTYTSLGSPQSVTANSSSATVWVDSGTTYTYTNNPLGGSTSSERWYATSGASGTVSSSTTISPTYYHQYQLTVTSTRDSPSPPAGSNWENSGTSVTATVSHTSGSHTCTGWTGTGSVPASGTTNSVTFTITAPSTITWNWS